MMKKALIIGYSGHAYVMLDILISNGFEVLGYFEREEKINNPYKLKYLGVEENKEMVKKLDGNDIYICIGANKIRAKVFENMISLNMKCPLLISKSAQISPLAIIGYGTVIMPGVIINACAEIGKAVICNSSSVIEHECRIDDYSHIAPGVVLAGNVKVGKYSFVGANTVVKQGINIGSNVIIGAGSVIVKDIPDNTLVYGNPGRVN